MRRRKYPEKHGTGPLKTLDLSYDKESEKASPGYYEVLLKRVYASIYGSIKAELTATNGTGWHRYTYSTTSNTWLEAAYPYMLQEVDSVPYASPDNILESSYDYWALSEIAGIIGKENDRKKFGKSQSI